MNLAISRTSRLESSMSEKSKFYDDPHILFIFQKLFYAIIHFLLHYYKWFE